MKPAWNFSLLQFAIKLTSLISFMQCIHIEDPYEHMDKYYQYGYQVDDHYTGDYHGHMEHTAGQLTKGEYKVKLPDGRVQVVSYEADHAGFRPRVTYEGVAAAPVPEPAPALGYHDRPSLLPTPRPPPSHKHSHHDHNKQTIIKIPYQKPEEEFVMRYHEILPTPIPKHHHQPKTHHAVEHLNEYQPTHVNHPPSPPEAVEHHFHPEMRHPMMVTVTPAPGHHPSPGPSSPGVLVPAPVTISPSLFVPHHSHHTSQRRYSIEDTQASQPRRARPTTYNEMRLVTPSPLGYTTMNLVTTSTPLRMNLVTTPGSLLTHSTPAPATPKPLNIQTFSTPSPTLSMVNTAEQYISKQFSNHRRPVLPPINNHPEPLLTHRAEPMMSYQQHTENMYSSPEEIKEEPKYLVQLVPNPKYKPKPTTQRSVEIFPLQNQSQDPNLYPYLYLMSSYLPQTQHSLVVAKKS